MEILKHPEPKPTPIPIETVTFEVQCPHCEAVIAFQAKDEQVEKVFDRTCWGNHRFDSHINCPHCGRKIPLSKGGRIISKQKFFEGRVVINLTKCLRCHSRQWEKSFDAGGGFCTECFTNRINESARRNAPQYSPLQRQMMRGRTGSRW